MKRPLQLIILFLFSLSITAQVSTPNGNFESWTSTNFEFPLNYFTNNMEFIQSGIEPGCIKSNDAYHGSYALQLTTYGEEGFSMAGNYNPNNPPPWNGGFPYAETPTGLRGYYKSDIPAGDSAILLVNFSKAGSNIGFYIMKFFGTHSTYTAFDFVFDPPLPMAPDSVIVFFVSSDILNEFAIDGSTITIDSINFIGVASQPALLNGDFENWVTATLTSPDFWHQSNDGENSVIRTTDKVDGNYAAELITYLRDDEYGPRAESQRLSSYYWDDDCECELGGYPFSQQIDTLAFWYKYIPSGEDTANVMVSFYKNGIGIDGLWEYLLPTPTYLYVEFPFNIGDVPDTVKVEFASSIWADSLPSFVGSNLKIDEVHFKSQPLNTGISTSKFRQGISVYPNPSNGIFNLYTGSDISKIEVLNITGQAVYSDINIKAGTRVMNLENQPKGVYLYRISDSNKVVKTGKLIIQ